MTITRTGPPAPEPPVAGGQGSILHVLRGLLAITALLAGTACAEIPAADELPAPGEGTASPEDPPDKGPLSGRTVVIDPGHNGGNADASAEISESVPAGPKEKECDTVGSTSPDGYAEHEFTWQFSQQLGEALKADGAAVVLTREDDEGVGPCIDERAEIGNNADADAAISIHADGADVGGPGFHVIAPGEVEGYTEEIVEPSRRLAEDVREEFHAGSGQPYAGYISDDGLDVRTDLGGLNLSTVPKVFLEVGNLRDEEDAESLRDEEWREQAAEAVAAGLSRYLLRD